MRFGRHADAAAMDALIASTTERVRRESASEIFALKARLAAALADVAALNDGWETTAAQLDAAEATISRVRELVERFNWHTHTVWCAEELEAALAGPDGGKT